MAISNFNPKRIFAGLMSVAMFFVYALPLPVLASEISGVTPTDPTGNVYKIEGQKFSGQTQFRNYDKFNLSKGDIANLMYKDGYKYFVNLVKNQVNINGIVNTMKGNNFFNGHAIFVSPQGIVIGASGVLNVGSLSLMTPSTNKFNSFWNAVENCSLSNYEYNASGYKGTITDSHGNIIVNGKIIARENVELYGDTITVKGTTSDKAGIIAGVGENETTVISTEDAAKALFDNLVTHNIKDTKNFALVGGKVKIVAGYEDTNNPELVKNATVTVDNAQIGGEEVNILANSKTERIVDLPADTSSFTPEQIEELGFGVADEATSKIEITNSEFGGKDIKIEANSVSKTKTNVNLLKPTIFDLVLNDEAKASEYFSSEVFSGFEGGRANAIIKVENSTINSKNNINIGTNADVEFEINSKILGQAIPAILYGLGTKTVSTVDVIKSVINADSDVSINALSSQESDIGISNFSLVSMSATNALVMTLLNYSNVTDTHAVVDSSKITASNLDVVAINMSKVKNDLIQTATIGKNDFATGDSYGSGAALSILFNRSKNDVKALIKDSTITVENQSDDSGIKVLAQSINVTNNTIKASADDDNYRGTRPQTFDQEVKNKLKDFKNKYMKHTIKSLFKRGNADVNMDQAEDAKVQASGVFLWNVSNNSATAKIENSTITAKKMDVKSYTLDLLGNKAMTDAVGEAYFGAGIALIVNDETNTTTSNIDKNSVVTVDELNMDSTTQLPMNAGSIKFGLTLPFSIFGVKDIAFGVNMEGDPASNWDFSLIYPGHDASTKEPAVSWEGFADQNITDSYGGLKPKLKLGGFFNNFAQASGNGNTAALSGTFVVNNVKNSTTASITGGSNVTVKNGDAVLNAVNSVMGYNAVGIVDYIITQFNYRIPGQEDWKYEPNVNGANAGVGGSVLVNNYTNNASAKIEGSTVDVKQGDLKVRSASEQSYLSALATGGKSETFVLDGSVHVQNLHGTTSAEILNSTITNAKNITVDAGNARIKPSASQVKQNEETSELVTKDERDSKDKILNIILTGAIAQQAEETDPGARVPQGSTGTAIGADVNVTHSDRTVRAKIDGSTITATEDILINSDSKNQTINVAFAGSFAGGVYMGAQPQGAPQPQEMQNAGNWRDLVNNAQDDDDPFGLINLFDENNPNNQGARNAREHAADIDGQNDNVDNDGNVNPNPGGNNGNNPGNNNGNMADGGVGAGEARNNFSLAAAGVIDLYWDKTTTESVLTNSTVTVGKKLDVKAKNDNLYVDIGGGVARAGNVGAGAAINLFNKNTTTRALVGDDTNNVTITYTSDSDKQLNVIADDKLVSVGAAIGVGIAKKEGEEESDKKFTLGGSFNGNILKETTEATIRKATVKNGDNVSGNIKTDVKAKNDSIVVNATGGVAYTGMSDHTSGAAAGLACDWDYVSRVVKAQIIGSTIENASNITVETSMPLKAYSAGISASVVNGGDWGYTFDGALVTEWYANTLSSLIKDSNVSASGDVNVLSDYDVRNMSLAGGLSYSSTDYGGFGVGIGAVVYIEKNNISANTDKATIKKSNSIKLESKSKEDMKFLAANLGMQANEGKQFNLNGVASVFKSIIEAKAINNSSFISNGEISILADYDNSNQGITVVGEKTREDLAFGANILGSFYDSTVQAELESSSTAESKKTDDNDTSVKDVRISATSKEYLNYIPISAGIASGGGSSVGANIVVNVLKNTTNAYAYGDITTTGKLVVKALDDTTVYERGGVLQYSGSGTIGVGSTVFYDYLNKHITAEVKNNTINAGDVTVQATAENAYGGTKKDDGTWDVSDMSTDPSDYGENFSQSSFFFNWNMAYSFAHGDKASSSGSIIVRVLDDIVKANVEGVNNKSNSLTVFANDYTIMNTIAGEFNMGKIGVGGNSLVIVGNADTRATVTDGSHTLSGDLSVLANAEKVIHTVLVGGSLSGKVAVNGSAYVNKLKDNIISSVIGSTISANKVRVNATQKNDNMEISVSAAISYGEDSIFSLGGILNVNNFEDTTKAIIGNNSTTNKTKITSDNDIEVKSDSDYEARVYLVSVGVSQKIGISGMGIANVMDSTIESGIYNSDVTSTNGKLDVISDRGFNKKYDNKTAFFRNWFKNTDAYKNEGVNKNTKERSVITEGDLGSIAPLVGAINVSASGKGAVTGSIIVNKSRGSLTSKIDNSTISTKTGSNVVAQQNFTNFDAVASVAGTLTGSLNGVGVINSFVESVTAWVDNSTINSGSITTDAQSNMNLNQLILSGQGAGKGADIGVVVDYNNIEDDVYSYITNTTAQAGASVYSAHNIMINNILLAGGGVGQGLTANVAAIVNYFGGEKIVDGAKVKTGQTISKIENSTINNGSIDVKSFDYIDNLSAVVGISFAGQGANLAGYAIRNALSNKANAFINNSTLNTTGEVNIFADSVISTTNAIFSAGIAGQGATILANVISNTITSDVEGYIKDSTITKAGDINIVANVNNDTHKYRYDEMTNTTGNVSFAGQGAALSTNVIYTNYSNTVKTYVENTSSASVGNLTLDANSERRLDNINIGIGGAGEGAAVAVNAISTDIVTTTHSYIDAKSKTMDKVGSINVLSRDNTDLKNIMGTVQIAGLGVAVGCNLDMTWTNNFVKSEILSQADGHINASSATVKSDNLIEFSKTNVGVSAGLLGGLGGDYVLIKSGKGIVVKKDAEGNEIIDEEKSYTQSEKDSGIHTAIGRLGKEYVSKSYSEKLETGAGSNVNANLKTKNNIDIKAESKIKGRGDNEDLSLTNVTVTLGLGNGSVSVRDVDLASNTFAGVTGGVVNSETGNVSVSAKNTSKVDIDNVDVRVGIGFSGGSAMYSNSSQTLAEIKDATVNASGNVGVISESISKSIINATNVIGLSADVVSVDLAENKDTNNSVALITGNTNIDAGGKLTVHSTATTDLESTKVSVKVQVAGLVNVSKSEVTAGTICQALIKDVTGTIKSNGLDIISDYGKMYALSKFNVIEPTLVGIVNYQDSAVKMDSTFISGIDSVSGLVLKNTGTTNIVTAKDNGGEGIATKGEIYNVTASVLQFVAASFADAQNTAKSYSYLKSKDFTTDDLNINSYLNSSAKAEATGTKVDLAVGVNVVYASSKDTSILDINIDGKNTVNQNATINAEHISNTYSDLSAFGFSLLASGGRIRIDTDLKADTTGTIGGKFDANETKVNMSTVRNAILSKSSGNGSVLISVNDSGSTSNLTGSSTLNIIGLKTDASVKNNNLSIKNTSANTMDIKSSDGSGAGLIAVSAAKTQTTFNTSTTTNIINSKINSNNDVGFEVSNSAVINDSARAGSGAIFIAVADTEANNSYTSNSKLSIKNSEINATNINLKSVSDIRTPKDVMVDYVGGAGGFIAGNEMKLTNTINQTSEIEINESKLYASDDIVLSALTSSLFRQKTDSTVGGFVAIPRSKNWLTVTNNNTITIDSYSKLMATDELCVKFDSNNTLEARAISEAHHFGFKDPVSESYLTLTVNNTLTNEGSMEAGNLADINFMQESVNNLTQYAYSEAHAAIPTTTEDGMLTKKINNNLQVKQNADITSGKDVEITYSIGQGSNSSTIAYKSVCYVVFGIPIETTGSKSKTDITHTPKLGLEGKIVAGQGNSKYMKIDRYGNIDKDSLKGFYDDEYILSDGAIIPGEVVKQKILASIKIEMNNVDGCIVDVRKSIEADESAITELNEKIAPIEEKFDEITNLIDNGAILLKSNSDEDGHNAFNDLVQADTKALVVGDSEAKISEDKFNTIMTDYKTELENVARQNEEITSWNAQHPDEKKEYIVRPTMSDFINSKDYNLSDAQKNTISDGYNTVSSRMVVTEKAKFTTYTNNDGVYVAAKNPRVIDGVHTCDEIIQYQTDINSLNKQLEPYKEKLITDTASLNVYIANKESLVREYSLVAGTPPERYEQKTDVYSITFNDITPKDSHIIVTGAYNTNITGGGVFSVASCGLKVDNYSTRSIIFNRINAGEAGNNGLFIGGREHSEFSNKPQAVSGLDAYMYIQDIAGHKSFDNLSTDGAHYITGDGGIAGITVNNYYDINHPFASTFDIPFPTKASDLIFMGDINTNADFKVWNESGSIFVGNNSFKYKDMSLISTNGNILLMLSGDKNTPCVIKSNDYIFACNGLTVWADRKITVDGTIKTGYSNRSITITEDMIKPENLIIDDTSGEKNMIDLGGDNISPYLNETNNMKAIYVDGQIYLYSCSVHGVASSNGVNFIPSDDISITGHITMADGYQNITINNKTTSQLNVSDIINTQILGHVADSIYNAFQDKFTINKLDHATTTISSVGKLVLNGNIHNNLAYGSMPVPNGVLNITANNGLDINPRMKMIHNVETLVDSILAGGTSNITINGGIGNIKGRITTKGVNNITNNGNDALNISGDIYNDSLREISSTAELITLGHVNIINEGSGALNLSGLITQNEGIVSVQSNGQTEITNVITDKKGDVYIASKGLNLTENAKIVNNEGNVTVTNNPYAEDSTNVANLVLNGEVNAQNGSIHITNNGDSATLGLTKTVEGVETVVGKIIDEKGDIVIENTKGDMTITSNISHDYVSTNSNGLISITNSGEKLIINSNLSTTGSGGTDGAAIIVDNQSNNYGLTLNGNVSARKGDVIIKNKNKDMLTAGTITNTELGGVSIINEGDSLTDTAKITVNSGNINIINNGSSKSEIKGSIINKNGNTTIENSGEGLVYSGEISNSGGKVTITNAKDAIYLTGDILNKGGDIEVTNNGTKTEISSNLVNKPLTTSDGKISGSILIINKDGDFNILDTAVISNESHASDKSIVISNIGNNFLMQGVISSIGKGYISILNSGNKATITGDILAKDGNINITNFDAGELIMSGTVMDNKGKITLTNSSSPGAKIGGYVFGEENDIDIINTKGDLNITAEIGLNSNAVNKGGKISIINRSEAGKVNINAIINNEGEGHTDGAAIVINNESIYSGMSINGGISARLGNIEIKNKTDDLSVAGMISNYEQGGVNIINKGVVLQSSAQIITKNGDINLTNDGTGNLQYSGEILNQKGDTIIANRGAVAGIDGTILAKDGDVEITNSNAGALNITGSVIDEKGALNITNNSTDGVNVSGTVNNKSGNITVENTAGALTVVQTGRITDEKGDINISNTSQDKGTVLEGEVLANLGNITLANTAGGITVAGTGSIIDKNGAVNITNSGADGITVKGNIADENGVMDIINNVGGITITTTGVISDAKDRMNITNNGANGILVAGYIKGDKANVNITNKDSNITIGEFESNNDKYIDVNDGNLVITQTNGNILNGVSDPINRTHSNYDYGDTEKLAYKTLISVTNDLTMNVTDGDIGVSGNSNPGYSINATTRDYTDSINVNIGGSVTATAKNDSSADERLVNLRAKQSDLNIKGIDSDGNVIITASDWKQADADSKPDSAGDETGYYVGYSVLSSADAGSPAVKGKNISVISSNNLGDEFKKLSYFQYQSEENPNATVSFEAENDIFMSGKATQGYETKIYQLISKRGSIEYEMESDADIVEITSGKGLRLTQKAQNLTIRNLGLPITPEGETVNPIDDILYPHDGLVFTPDPDDPTKVIIPNYVVIRVLDAIDTPDRADSNLIIYSAYVKGNHGENAKYYPDGSRLADYTLMADNIYANSYKAPNSTVHTKENPNGVKLKGRTYTNEDIDPSDTVVREATGINGYGDGEAISVDILGVDKDIVDTIVPDAQRHDYIIQRSKKNVPDPFKNKYDRTKFYDYDFKADNVYLSVNDYAYYDRGVSIDTVYADNAYINTHDTNLSVQDGYINNYAEFRNKTKLAVVDNDYRRTVDSDMQLFTAKTGSFSMGLSNSTIMNTTAPVVDFNPYRLVNTYSSENSFVNLTFKETSLRQKEKDVYKELQRKNDYTNKEVSLVYSTAGFGLLPDNEIYEVSRTGATINANDLKVGQKTTVKLQLNDVNVDIEAKVKEIHGDKATVQFLNMPDEISNQIMFEYMKKINSMKNSISSL